MKTILEAAKDYILGNRQGCPSTSESEDTDIFISGVNFAQQWIPVDEELPIDRKLCIVKDCNNEYSIMIGEHIINWTYPFIEKGYITHWRKININ
jgi:hypothetical protein